MESEGRTAATNESSQEILKKEVSRVHLDHQVSRNESSNHATKIFVGGLPNDLTKEELKAYFEKFGSIEDVVVMCDKETNKPRRFGFVTFKSPETVKNVLKTKFYQLKNKRVEVKEAISKEKMTGNFGNNNYVTYNAIYNGNYTFPYANAAAAFYGNYYGGDYYYGMNNYGYGGYGGLGFNGLSYVYYPYRYQNPNPSYYGNTYPYQSPYYYPDTYSYQSPSYYGNTSRDSHKYRNRTPVVIKKNPRVKNGDGGHAVRKNARISSLVNGEKLLENGDGGHVVRKEAKLVVDGEKILENGDGDHGVNKNSKLSLVVNGEHVLELGDGDGDEHVVVIKKNSHVNNGDGDHVVNMNSELSLVVNDEVVLEKGDGDHAEISEGLDLCCNGEGDGDGVCIERIQALSLYCDGPGEEMAADGHCSSCRIDS